MRISISNLRKNYSMIILDYTVMSEMIVEAIIVTAANYRYTVYYRYTMSIACVGYLQCKLNILMG